ncbi:MAG: hypothetical protein AB8C02_11305 [Halioglobus sp.]
MKGIRVSLKGLLLAACASVVHVLPAQAASIVINASDTGEVLQQGAVYSHSPLLQELSYEFLGFSPSGVGLEERQRSGYAVYDLSSVNEPIIGASLAFDVNVTDAVPGELVVSTIESTALNDVVSAPVGPLTQAHFDTVFAALSSGVTAATQVLSSGATTVNIGLGAASISHLSSAVSLVGFHILYAANALQDLSLALDTAPRLLLTTLTTSPAIFATVPSPSTLWLLGPGVLLLLRFSRSRRG